MATLTATLVDGIAKAVIVAVREEDAPRSAWPAKYPGVWATAARVAEILGIPSSQVSYHLKELVESGELVSANPWPGATRGYQPAAEAERTLFALPEIVEDERRWMLHELRRWAALNDGHAPRRKDWSKENDPDRAWPRSVRVDELFRHEAQAAGVRRWVDERCGVPCACSTNRHYTNAAGHSFCDGCFDCLGRCPHGDVGHWVGPSGWRYALQLAGLAVRTGAE